MAQIAMSVPSIWQGRFLHARLVEAIEALGPDRGTEGASGHSPDQVEPLDDRARLGRVLASMALGLMITADLDGAIAAGQQALELAVKLGDRVLRGEASLRLGPVYYAIGDFGRLSCYGATWRPLTESLMRLVQTCRYNPARGWHGP